MGSIGIVGLGSDPDGTLPASVVERLRTADKVVVASASGEAAQAVRDVGVEPLTFEDFGLAASAPSAMIVEVLATLAEREGHVVLATAGYPLLRQGIVSGLLDRSGDHVGVFPATSPLGVLVLALDIDLTADLDIVDVASLGGAELDRDSHLIITGVSDQVLARRTGERLIEAYSPDHPVVLAERFGADGFDLHMTSVADLDRISDLCDTSILYVAPSRPEPLVGFSDLVRILAALRGPDGCPWDLEQTPMSLRKHVIEEAYEVVSAIEAQDQEALADELGDLLLQIVFQAQIASEEGRFDIGDVTAGITRKLRRRHPHIFGGGQVADADEVSRNWDAIKRGEKEGASVLHGVPPALPSLARAQKISKRAAGIGFDWETVEDVWEKVHEEIEELKSAKRGTSEVADEVGDVLFTVVNVARKLGVDAEIALRDACDKFTRRFTVMEEQVAARGLDLAEMAPDEMERLWQDAKGRERADGASG